MNPILSQPLSHATLTASFLSSPPYSAAFFLPRFPQPVQFYPRFDVAFHASISFCSIESRHRFRIHRTPVTVNPRNTYAIHPIAFPVVLRVVSDPTP